MLSSSIYTVIKHIHAFYFFRFTSGKYFNLLEDTKVTLDKKKKRKKAGKYFNLLKGTKNTLDKKKKHIKRNRQIFKPVEMNKMQP